MILRGKTRFIAALLLGVILFAQGVIALADCEAGRAPAKAMQHAMAGMDDMVCCSEEAADADASMNANLCLAHCTNDAQRADGFAPQLPAVQAFALFTLAPVVDDAAFALRRQLPPVRGFTTPPLTILFQNFRV